MQTTQGAGDRPARSVLLLAYAIIYIIWGSTYLGIKFSIETIPPFFSGGVRFLIAGMILFGFRKLQTGAKTTLKNWFYAFWGGLLPFTITYGVVTTAELIVPSSIAALIIAIEPVWFCIVGWLCFGGARPTKFNVLALVIGFSGVAFLVVGDPDANLSMQSSYLFWIVMIMLSNLSWVFGAFISRNPKIHTDPFLSSGMQMLCGGAMMMLIQILISAVTGVRPNPAAFSMRSMAALCYLIVFGSIVAYSAFLWLMRVEPPNRVATHTFVNPIIAVILGWLLGGESIHTGMLIGTPLIVTSVLLMVWDPRSKIDEEPLPRAEAD